MGVVPRDQPGPLPLVVHVPEPKIAELRMTLSRRRHFLPLQTAEAAGYRAAGFETAAEGQEQKDRGANGS